MRTKLRSPEPGQLALLPDEPKLTDRHHVVLDESTDESQLEMLPEWDGTIPVPYGVIPF